MKKKIKITKNEKGITLIALVVTIVVLLILAGVTINFVLGEGGILDMAKETAKKTEEAKQKELGDFENLSGIIDEAINGEDPKTLEEALKNQKFLSFTTKYDSNGNKIEEDNEESTKAVAITIPAGFKVLEGTDIEQGIVISDKDGNEFVWVPCTKDEYKMHDYSAREDKNDEGNNLEDKDNGGWNTWYYTKYNDWTGDLSQEEVNEQSVEKYGGFYIARYEAGIPSNMTGVYVDSNSETKTYNTNDRNTSKYVPVSQKGKQAWNYISQTNAKTVSEKMYAGSGSVTSRLVDGIAWDRTVEWIAENSSLADKVKKDSTQVGNYANNGSDIGDKKSSPSKIKYQGFTVPNTLFAEHLYKVKRDGVVNMGWCYATNYQYGVFTAGYADPWDGPFDNYNNYEPGETYYYRHYVELATGASDNTKLKNIYDLGGNMYEWTTERGSHKENKDNETTYDKKTHAVFRGGSFNNYGDNSPVSIRYGRSAIGDTDPNFGFRVVLYVK